MIQQQFAQRVTDIVRNDEDVLGLAAAGSWISGTLDEWSDLDLVLVTREKIGGDGQAMLRVAARFGSLLSGFTGEHVGEPRVLICLYDNPLLHVDIKFVTLKEFGAGRIETPVLLFDRDGGLQAAINNSEARWPQPDPQWIENRFWTWIHYALLKIGRGEYFEALDFLSCLRQLALGPLLQLRRRGLPRGVRRIEQELPAEDQELLKATVAGHDRASLTDAVIACIRLYRTLRNDLEGPGFIAQARTEEAVLRYLHRFRYGGS
ncbi:nucleotidyltransferase domain-containing protein [Flaviaesturariibacter flavus]|uniref:Nucleotidyltransferase domain-containing protein n=1 Tax=Flaviaesturariibacter flavus TaxID=2502780 RepID=A0A4R1BAK6_9BACT|nr:nucleotidyltransferase domain-containing protein [Flaviaesturariibacter flavus]TCJ14006.1 nucleotidyltransferase domain-containing protein [Flaviaesturariibacter flavus]